MLMISSNRFNQLMIVEFRLLDYNPVRNCTGVL